jgi:hypothetical protein
MLRVQLVQHEVADQERRQKVEQEYLGRENHKKFRVPSSDFGIVF